MSTQESENIIADVAKAKRPQLMEGYRQLLQKYREITGARGTTEKNIATKQAASQYQTVGEIGEAISRTKLTINSSLQEIENKITGKFEEAKRLEENITERQRQLKELYEIEEAAGSLIALVEAKEEVKRETAAEKEALELKRKQEEEEYRFTTELQKRKDKESYEAEKRKLDNALEEREQALAEKEAAFAARLTELDKLKVRVDQFPEELAKEKSALAERMEQEAKKEKDMAIMLLKKEMEALQTVAEAHARNLEALLAEQKNISKSLQDQLKAAQAQTQEVVLKSIDNTASNRAMDAINKLTSDQNRTINPKSA